MPLLSLGLCTGGVHDKRLTFMFEPYSCFNCSRRFGRSGSEEGREWFRCCLRMPVSVMS